MATFLDDGIVAYKNRNSALALQKFKQMILADPLNADAWLWLGIVIKDPEKKQECFTRVLLIDKDNIVAQNLLQILNRNERTRQEELGQLNNKTHTIVESNYSLQQNPGQNSGTIMGYLPTINAVSDKALRPSQEFSTSQPWVRPTLKRGCQLCECVAEPEDLFCINCGRPIPALQNKSSKDQPHPVEKAPNGIGPIEIPSVEIGGMIRANYKAEPETSPDHSRNVPAPEHIPTVSDVGILRESKIPPRIEPAKVPPNFEITPGPVTTGISDSLQIAEGPIEVPIPLAPNSSPDRPEVSKRPMANEEMDKEDQKPRFNLLVDLALLVLHIGVFFVPWMYGEVSSLFGWDSGTFSALTLFTEFDGFALPIFLFYILTWAAYILSRSGRKKWGIITSVLAGICQLVVISQINGIGSSDYGPSRSFLGGGFTGSVYVKPYPGVYLALAAPIMIVLGTLFSKSKKRIATEQEAPIEDRPEKLAPVEAEPVEENLEKSGQGMPIKEEKEQRFNFKAGCMGAIACSLGATIAAGPLAGIPAGIIIFFVLGFAHKGKKIF